MRAKLLPTAILVVAFLPLLATRPVSAESPSATISGGDLSHAIHLAAADADALTRRLDRPPKLKDAPSPEGPSYTVTTSYWDTAARATTDHATVSPDATYYPRGGYVKASKGGDDVWLVLDLRQRAILDRYIRLGVTGKLSSDPTMLDVVRAAAAAGEPISVQVGPKVLDPGQTTAFWQAAAMLGPGAAQPNAVQAANAAGAAAVVFGLPEGRSLSLVYVAADGLLFDDLAGQAYIAPAGWLVPVLGPEASTPERFAAAYGARPVPQQSSPGSRWWWAVMVGGGLVLIAAAFILQHLIDTRRQASARE